MINKIYSFIGLPASGKGTQAMSFAEERDYTHISIGDLVREKLQDKNGDQELIFKIKELYDAGKPVTDEIVFKLLTDKLKNIEGGVVFDNFPFNKSQSEFLLNYVKENNLELPRVIYIKIDPESAIKRISSRKICPKCKSVFIGGTNCERCGEKLITRSDDNEETVRKRIQNYLPNIKEVESIFRPLKSLYEIDGEPAIPEVKEQVRKIQ